MLASPHPVFGDWCYCNTGDSQCLLDRQLSYRAAALKQGRLPVTNGGLYNAFGLTKIS